MPTFAAQRDDVRAWLDRLLATLQEYYTDLQQYERVITQPDPALLERHLEDTRIYDRSDPLIVTARGIQRGQRVPEAAVEAAVAATTERASRYARALPKGLGYLLTAGRLWEREIDEGEARRGFAVGVAELSLAFKGQRRPASCSALVVCQIVSHSLVSVRLASHASGACSGKSGASTRARRSGIHRHGRLPTDNSIPCTRGAPPQGGA
jgi:hypothetical protein